jgi:hypothetical protein
MSAHLTGSSCLNNSENIDLKDAMTRYTKLLTNPRRAIHNYLHVHCLDNLILFFILYLQVLLTVTAVSQVFGTVKVRLGSASQLTVPELATLINLYSNDVPAAIVTVVDHKWFELVYCDADSAGALPVFQLPSSAIEPTTLTV